MIATKSEIPDVVLFEPTVFNDSRGFFLESFNAKEFRKAVGLDRVFVQDNLSRSNRGVLRGLHYQIRQTQGKLVRVLTGEVFDVAVDLRRSSETFGRWVGINLSAENKRAVWIPEGFAHGFLVLSDYADFLYKTTDYWSRESERTIIWNDPALAIAWPIDAEPVVSLKDRNGALFSSAEFFA